MRFIAAAFILSLAGSVVADETAKPKALSVTVSADSDHAAKLAMDDRIKPLLNRRTAFTNRPYWWVLPKKLPFAGFIPIAVGEKEEQKIEVVAEGWIHIAVANEGPDSWDTNPDHVTAFARQHEWEKTDIAIGYRVPLKQRATPMSIYRKKVPIGELTIPRVNWSGPVIVIP